MGFFNKFKTSVKESSKVEVDTGPSPAEIKAKLIENKKKEFISTLSSIASELDDDSDIHCLLSLTVKSMKKLDNAYDSYGHKIEGHQILLVDTTTFGKADNGFIITSKGIALCESFQEDRDDKMFISYEDMNSIQGATGGVKINNHRYEFHSPKSIDKLRPIFSIINRNLDLYN